MPELPDVLLYVRALERRIEGQKLSKVILRSPFVLRTVTPDIYSVEGQQVCKVSRLVKRIVWKFDRSTYLVFHLMIAGRFHWHGVGALPRSKIDLAAFQFNHGTLKLTEASPKKRASISVIEGDSNLMALDRGGKDVLAIGEDEFIGRLCSENHTLKRALTDPRLFDGIGNAYSDEILHTARLSPVKLTSRLTDEEIRRLYTAIQTTLQTWIRRLSKQTADRFPEKVTAFRPEMAVHGKFGLPCPVCGSKVQRIVRAESETNYCPRCQTEGKILKDRSLSRLLKDDWPGTVDEVE
ncbi:MAG: formamidopyrimidine-DNA glycosylase [Planctomycetales bacterium]|nr:formamidopyrimidine-DNA glycosylase [Planctomycetales bacterium]